MNQDDIISRAINYLFKVNIGPDEEERGYWDRFCAEKIASHEFTELNYFFQKKVYAGMSDCFLSKLGDIKGEKILEAGCGSGYLSILMAERGAKITLLDNSKLALKYSHNLLKKVEFIKKKKFQVEYVLGDVRKLPFNDNTFDVVHNCGVVEHYDDVTVFSILNEMTRVAKSGGHIIVIIPNLLSPEIIFRMIRYGKGSERYFGKDKLKTLMQNVGLKRVTTYSAHASVVPSCLPEKIHSQLGFLDDKAGFLDYLVCSEGLKS